MRTLMKIAFAAAAVLLAAGPAPASTAIGVKNITNTTKFTLTLKLWVRDASARCCTDLGPFASATVKPGKTVAITYGNAANPDLNELDIYADGPGDANLVAIYATDAAGTGKTLDALFNSNAYIAIGYRATGFGFTLAGHN